MATSRLGRRAGLRLGGATAAVGIVFAATTVANASNYIYTVALGRLLGPAEFGDFSSLFALLIVLSLLGLALQATAAGRAGELLARHGFGAVASFGLAVGRRMTLVGGAVALAWTAASPLVARMLNIDSTWTVAITGTALIFGFSSPALSGVLQGAHRFGAFAASLIVMAVARLAIGIPAVAAGAGVAGAIGAHALAVGAAVVVATVALVRIRRSEGATTVAAPVGEVRRLVAASGPALLGLLAWTGLSSLDVVYVKAFADADEAGLYSAASSVGKIALFFPVAFAYVAFPAATARVHAGLDPRPVLRRAGRAVLGIGVLMVAAAAILGEPAVVAMFGADYRGARDLIVPVVIAMACFSVLNVMVFYYLAVRHLTFVATLGAMLAVQAAAGVFLGADPTAMAWSQAALGVAIIVMNETVFEPILLADRGRGGGGRRREGR